MKAPASFNAVCRNFIQDLELIAGTPEGVIDFAIQDLDVNEMRELNGFLDELLGGIHTHEELQALWWSSPAEIHFRDGNKLLAFLALMQARIARSLV